MHVLMTLMLGGHDAFAFAPSDDVHQGIEPSRLQHVHIERQHRLRQGHGWSAWDQAFPGWQVVFDERAGTPFSMWGGGIAIDTSSSTSVVAELEAILEDHRALSGVGLDELRLKSANYSERTDTWFVEWDRLVEGVPVWRGGVRVVVDQGNLVHVKLATYPHASLPEPSGDVASRRMVTADQALEQSIVQGPAADVEHSLEGAELVLLPRDEGNGLAYRLVYETRTRTTEVPGIWVSHVDAWSGSLVNVYNEVRFLEGSVTAVHDTRTVDGNFSKSPMPLVVVSGEESDQTTTDDGSFDAVGGVFATDLDGQWLRVRNGAGDDAEAWFEGSDYTWTDEDATQAEIDSYVFLHQIRDWGLTYGPDVDIVTDRLRSTVNKDSTCNAYYDGNVNFYSAGGGCNNTGRIADVNYHEWGHGFHGDSLQAGVWDGSMGEGIGDIIAVLQTGDPIMAPYFATSGSGIRRVDTDKVYPDDVTGEVHADGLIYAGAAYDWWLALQEETNEEVAFALSSQVLADAIRLGPTIEESYDAYALADDDDGDLSNGTPHTCSLLEAFGPHGLGPGGATGGSLFYVGHSPLANQLPHSGDYTLSADITNLAGDCIDFTLAAAELFYSVDGGATWETSELTRLGDEGIEGIVPEQPPGTLVQYYLAAYDAEGEVAYAPSGGVINPHSFWVGELTEISCEDFEASDGGYVHELLSGKESEGADDWQWGEPAGLEGDPDYAPSGSRVWANDLGQMIGQQQWNGAYQSEKHNRLSSPPIELGEYAEAELVVQFQRWLNVEDGYYDQARVLIDGEQAWSNHESGRSIGDEHHQDQVWALHTLATSDVDHDGALTLSWEIESDGGLEFGGWTIDDVCVYAVTYGDSDLGTEDSADPGDSLGSVGLQPGGCGAGCASTAPSGVELGALLMGLGALLRRRRR
jgi:uncharacterized protein (TIGR03382 family)